MRAGLIIIVLFFRLISAPAQKSWMGQKPAWITPITYDYSKTIKQGEITEGYYYFLTDRQVDVSTKTYYNHYAIKLFNTDGVDRESKLNFNYNPIYEKLKVHSVTIHRGNNKINKLTDARYSELQREEDLEKNIYKGKITVNLILTDVRVGDIIEYDYSVIGDNPIFENKFYFAFYLNGYYDTGFEFYKVRHKASSNLNIRYANDSIAPVVSTLGDIRELVWELKDIKGLKTEGNMPSSIEPYNLVEMSEYNSWEEVAKWGVRVFAVQNREIAAISGFLKDQDTLSDIGAKIINCLRFTQDNIRYFGVEIGENSHRPKAIGNIVREGYGDCKDKTTLFCYLLHKIGVTAYPVLVNSDERGGIFKFIPSPSQFNHVITMVELAGTNYFFDPTITYQGGDINTCFVPGYGYGLALMDSTRYLTKLHHSGIFKTTVKEAFDIRSMKGRCDLVITTDYLGYDADVMRETLNTSNNEETRKSYREFYEKKYGDLDSSSFSYKDDRDANCLTISERYWITNIWSMASDSNDKKIDFTAHAILEVINKIKLEEKTRTFPLILDYPALETHLIEIGLPEDWNVTPQQDSIVNEFLAFNFSSRYAGNKIYLRYSIEIKEPNVPADKYLSFKKSVEKIKDEHLNYSISQHIKLAKKLSGTGYNFFAISFALLFSVLCLLVFLYCLRFFKPKTDEPLGPMAIGGWLILPLLGLVIRCLRILYTLCFDNFFESSYWLTYTDEGSSSYLKGYDAFLSFQICYNIAMFFLCLFTLIQFVKKNHKLPRLMIGYLLFFFLFQSINDYFSLIYSEKYTVFAFFISLLKSSVALSIWIPYFILSRRVKETFVR